MAQSNTQSFQEYCKGKSVDQVKVIKYFCGEKGCLEKSMTDDEYFRMVIKKRNSLHLRARALSKIGLDEDEVYEIPPVMFEGFTFTNAFAKRRANGNWVSSAYQVTWLFFSSTQIYIYRYTFHMDEDKKQENTDEFFYKDVTSLSTSSETEIAHGLGDEKFEIETNKFNIIVPGDKIFVSLDGVSNSEEVVQAMKQKLREKKQ